MDEAPAPSVVPQKRKIEVKVYLVIQRDHLVREGQPNIRVVAARLTRATAEAVRAKMPGTYIQRHIATK
jgi:hypothetical protein